VRGREYTWIVANSFLIINHFRHPIDRIFTNNSYHQAVKDFILPTYPEGEREKTFDVFFD
jgi:hypothetical protein